MDRGEDFRSFGCELKKMAKHFGKHAAKEMKTEMLEMK